MIDYFVKPSAGDQLEKNKSTEMTRLPKHTVPTLQDPKICLNAVWAIGGGVGIWKGKLACLASG
jgi:hypothetical protein